LAVSGSVVKIMKPKKAKPPLAEAVSVLMKWTVLVILTDTALNNKRTGKFLALCTRVKILNQMTSTILRRMLCVQGNKLREKIE
jgi:hypothetical protein